MKYFIALMLILLFTALVAFSVVPHGHDYPTGFIGPVRPGDTIGGYSPLR